MKRLRWQIFIVVVALAAIAILLLNQQETPFVFTEPGAEVVDAAQGGEYTEGLVGQLIRLNPLLDEFNPADRDINRLIFSSLIQFDGRGIPQGDLAETWGISQDGKTYNFSLKTGLFWHDGVPLTAEDVVFTVDMMRTPELPLPEDIQRFWQSVEVEALDESLLQFRLPEPYAPFLDHLTFGVIPEHLLGGLDPGIFVDDPFNLAPVGSGPYQFDTLLVDEDGDISGIILRANETYYNQRAFIDSLIFRYYPDPGSAFQAYQSGEVMGVSYIAAANLPDALQNPSLDIYTSRLPQLTLIYLNLENPETPFLADLQVRRALMHGLNRQKMVDQVLMGQAILADGPILPGTWAFYENVTTYAFDAEEAVSILRKAGYEISAAGGSVRVKEGQPLSFELLYPEGELYTEIAETVQRNWAAIGVEVTLTMVPYETLVNTHLVERNYQAALVDISFASSPDPDPYPFWHQTQVVGGQNYARWNDRVASEYLEQARITLDLVERARLYRNFQVRFSRELPSLPLFFPVYNFGVSQEIQGVRIGSFFDTSDRMSYISTWYLDLALGEGDGETP